MSRLTKAAAIGEQNGSRATSNFPPTPEQYSNCWGIPSGGEL
ncbi:hypothetical protein ACT3UD_09480 [Glutamicibacter sp. 287]